MAQPPPPVPNPANLLAAVNGMTVQGNLISQGVQAYIGHQQTLNTEISRIPNYNIAGIHQQLAAIRRDIAESRALHSAENWNLNAKIENMRVTAATGALVTMRSIDQNPNAQVQVGQPIPNFPATPDALSQMNVPQLCEILTALEKPLPPQGGEDAARLHRTAVRGAIGLPAL